MMPNELDRLAAAGHRLRPDWRADSLKTFLAAHVADRPYRDAAIALAWVATDPVAKTPNLLTQDGPWWAASRPAGEQPPTPAPPSRLTCSLHSKPEPCCECPPAASREFAAQAIADARAAIRASRRQGLDR